MLSENQVRGQRFRNARLRAGFTQEALAAEINHTTRAVQNWEEGKRFPRPGTMRLLAAATGKSIDYFYDGDEKAAA